MAKRTAECDLMDLQQLTADISAMLCEDRLTKLVRKCDENEDTNTLISEVEKAMQACLSIQEFMTSELGEKPGLVSQGAKAGEQERQRSFHFEMPPRTSIKSSESLSLSVRNPSDLFSDEEVYDDQMEIHRSTDFGLESLPENCLEEANPSVSFSSFPSIIDEEMRSAGRSRVSSLGFEFDVNQKSEDIFTLPPHSNNGQNSSGVDLYQNLSERSRSNSNFSNFSLCATNQSSELEDLDQSFSSKSSHRSSPNKLLSSVRNPSFDSILSDPETSEYYEDSIMDDTVTELDGTK